MKFFNLVRSGVDVAPLLEEILSQEDAWLANTSRQEKVAVQRETNTIFIRSAAPRPDLNINENQVSQFTRISQRFPHAVSFMTGVANDLNAALSRATIVRLKPQSQVGMHVDMGSYYFIRDRYHLILYSKAGSILLAGDEQVRMRVGELWRFDNKQHHAALNESDEWRIHYIFDLLPPQYSHLAVNPMAPLRRSERALNSDDAK